MIRKKANNNKKKLKIKVDIKIKLNQILRDEIEKKFKTKYITIKSLLTKFNIISK